MNGAVIARAAEFLSPVDFLRDLTNPVLAFLPRALLMAVVAAVVCGAVGVHVVLRGMAFIGDAVAHSVFPGLAIAFLTSGSLVLGGAIAGTHPCLRPIPDRQIGCPTSAPSPASKATRRQQWGERTASPTPWFLITHRIGPSHSSEVQS